MTGKDGLESAQTAHAERDPQTGIVTIQTVTGRRARTVTGDLEQDSASLAIYEQIDSVGFDAWFAANVRNLADARALLKLMFRKIVAIEARINRVQK